MDPYQILGLKNNASTEDVYFAYKNYMLLLHPDKAHTQEAKDLRLTQAEKNTYIKMIQNAYKLITDTKSKESKFPDYKIDYSIDNQDRINKTISEDSAFNSAFENKLKIDKETGFLDAFQKGYGEFSDGKNFNSTATVTAQQYSSGVDTNQSKNTTERQDETMIHYYSPSSFSFDSAGIDYQELGITNIDNFTDFGSGKSSIARTDLMSVYGNNYETWENTAMRNPKISSVFNNSGNIETKMKQVESSRSNMSIDPEITEMEKLQNLMISNQDKERSDNIKKFDNYYNNSRIGYLSF